jgi:predicted MPP superfamily phosphohydrolase
MWPVFPGSLTLLVIGVIVALVLFAMRIVQPEWWSSRPARIAVLVAFGGMLVGIALWGAGRSLESVRVVHLGAGIAYAGVLIFLPAAIVMPGAALIDRILMRVTRPADATDAPVAEATKLGRRGLLRFGSASLPSMAAIAGASGFVQAKLDPNVREVRLRWPDLHPDLEGLRILHLSDLHLGACLGLEDLARGLRSAARHRPDLIVLTGDLADDASLIPEALRLVAGSGARLGAFASLGNHEYLHDITVTRPLYEASPVPLVCGSGQAVRVGGATLFIGGADDPVHMAGDIPWFLTPSIEAAAARAPSNADFRLLLCHRPEGHGPATASGFDLTLSGHTHGGQLGFLGRSLLEKIKPDVAWWGAYAKARSPRASGPGGPSRLYTTSGFGHWFPFRVGCPTEMPLVILEGGGAKTPREPRHRA